MSLLHDRKTLLAFCHIEKAAGTSLIHVLRRVFFLRYADVRPMHTGSDRYFTSTDLATVRRLNPLLRAFGGHSVVPYGDLVSGPEKLAFITQVRDPMERAASQYKYRVNKLNIAHDLQSFLRHPASRNVQVRKLAGCENLELARENILNHFLLAGTVDRFDEFLVLLANKLGLPFSMFTYSKRNIDSSRTPLQWTDEVANELRQRNQLDQQLYDWISTDLYTSYIAKYQGDFSSDLQEFRRLQQANSAPKALPLVEYVYRKAYLHPASGLIRVAHGLPYRGSYSTN